MDDLSWLRSRTTITALGEDLTAGDVRALLADAAGCRSAVVHPTQLGLVPAGLGKAAVVGYPTGRHHSLIKAAEARLAVEYGATELWLAVDALNPDDNALLADIVAVRQAVPPPAQLAVLAPDERCARIAYEAGADAAVVDKPQRSDDIARVFSLAEAVAALEAGATRLVTTGAAAAWMTA